MEKKFKIAGKDLKDLLPNRGSCYATDEITVNGKKIGYMYREKPEDEKDSGWRFFSGEEDQEYVDNAENTAIYKLNTIANYDPAIIPYLDMPIGTSWERKGDTEIFEIIKEEIQ